MLTSSTQHALAALHDIAMRDYARLKNYQISEDELSVLLCRLEENDLIYLRPGENVGSLLSYSLSRPLSGISLLDVIEALDDHLDCNHPLTEEYYFRHGTMAQRLGVINQMTRSLLTDIKLTDC